MAAEEAPSPQPSSPKDHRLKFLCSFGGKILPRPSDGVLKYLGGETRVVSLPRPVSFSELKDKVSAVSGSADTVIKYRLMPEELDALVSVRSDEDLRHMLDEYDLHESTASASSSASPRLRLFLFPAAPASLIHHQQHANSPEQRYIDAINGVLSPPPFARRTHALSSAGSSPTSTTSAAPMHKAQSSPNLYLAGQQAAAAAAAAASATYSHHHHWPRPSQQQQQQHHPPSMNVLRRCSSGKVGTHWMVGSETPRPCGASCGGGGGSRCDVPRWCQMSPAHSPRAASGRGYSGPFGSGGQSGRDPGCGCGCHVEEYGCTRRRSGDVYHHPGRMKQMWE